MNGSVLIIVDLRVQRSVVFFLGELFSSQRFSPSIAQSRNRVPDAADMPGHMVTQQGGRADLSSDELPTCISTVVGFFLYSQRPSIPCPT